MAILSYFKSLIPSLEKRTILEDINNSLGELKTSTLPIFKQAQTPMGAANYKFKDKNLDAFAKKFSRDNKTGIKGNFIGVSFEVAKRLEENSDNLLKVVDVIFEGGMISSAITYKKASLLQYIEAMSFFQKYARKMLHLAYMAETAAVDSSVDVGAQLTDGEMVWLKQNEDAFIGCLTGLSMKAGVFVQALDETPDVIVNPDNILVVNATMGGKTDPFKMNFISANMNIIYHFRLRIAEWQNARYEAALQERKAIELRILHMQNVIHSKADPKLEEQIQYNEARLEKLNYKIKKMEEAYE